MVGVLEEAMLLGVAVAAVEPTAAPVVAPAAVLAGLAAFTGDDVEFLLMNCALSLCPVTSFVWLSSFTASAACSTE